MVTTSTRVSDDYIKGETVTSTRISDDYIKPFSWWNSFYRPRYVEPIYVNSDRVLARESIFEGANRAAASAVIVGFTAVLILAIVIEAITPEHLRNSSAKPASSSSALPSYCYIKEVCDYKWPYLSDVCHLRRFCNWN